MDFRKECEEWLNPLGYTISSHSADNMQFTFINMNSRFSPVIKCTLHPGGHKSCKVIGGFTLKMFLTLTAGDMMFKHPDIEKYIKVLTHYELVCYTHPPF